MKGRKISLEDRGPDAKKLGRKFKHGDEESERVVVSLVLKKGTMAELLNETKSKSKAEALSKLIEKELK